MALRPDEILDVAIVGGGVSGVYSGWRLLRAATSTSSAPSAASASSAPSPAAPAPAAPLPSPSAPPRIVVFEGSDRVGGRLLSPVPPDLPGIHVELGGMRYMSRHRLVCGLVRLFGFATTPMPVAEDENIAFLRGRQLRLADLADPGALPYRLTPAERHALKDPKTGSLLIFALRQILPDCTTLPYDDLLQEVRSATFGGRPLHEQGFWNVIARVLSPDAYWCVRDTGGYDCLVSNWSAADAIPFILADFGAGVTYSRFPGGYEEMPCRLAREFEQAGGEIALGARLVSFDTGPLPDTDQPGVHLRFADGRSVLARRLVLAMPRRSLELLQPAGAVLDRRHREVRALIESVMPIPLFKIFLCYDHPWWEAAGVTTGRSVTDMPIRQCYYWGVEAKTPTAEGGACLLASYDDDLSVTFWAGLRRAGAAGDTWPTRRRGAAAPPSPAEDSAWDRYRAPAAMVREAHRQIALMHGLASAPEPVAAAYRDWSDDPYGGGVNFWQIHAKSWEVMPAITQPRAGVPVYICGEAYSQQQGWVEGALQTAEIMLQSHFGLAPPGWADASTAAASGARA
jgi:monoamine oxidase